MHVYCLRSIKPEGGRLCRENYSRFLYSLCLHPRLRAYPFTQTNLRRKTFSTVPPLRPKKRLKLSSDNIEAAPPTAGCADVDPRMSCMHNRLIRLFGGTVCMRHAIRVNHIEIRCIFSG